MQENLSLKIKEKAYEAGYDLCGIIEANAFTEYKEYLNARVEKFPHSAHLYKNLHRLATPLETADWAKSVIVCVRRYNKYRIPQGLDKFFGKVYLFDGRLSYSKEYAGAVQFEEYLKEQGMRICDDGVTDRWAAVKAGLGRFGKNNFVYTKFGSWVWIDTWIVDAEMEYDTESEPGDEIPACPENCRRCIQACPTKALCADFTMDRGACIAQLSFYSTDLPPGNMRDKMGTWMYGCDICQDVCPKNGGKWSGEEDFPELGNIKGLLTLEQILTMDEITLLEVLQPRFWYISKERLWLWRCNALRAMANSGDSRYHPLMIDACKGSDEKIRTMALWACERVGIKGGEGQTGL